MFACINLCGAVDGFVSAVSAGLLVLSHALTPIANNFLRMCNGVCLSLADLNSCQVKSHKHTNLHIHMQVFARTLSYPYSLARMHLQKHVYVEKSEGERERVCVCV